MYLNILIFIFASGFFILVLQNSFRFQIFYRIFLRRKKLSEDFVSKTRGEYIEKGHFSTTRRVISESDFSNLFIRDKIKYSACYSIVKFKTLDADWELYFHLVRESGVFKEYMFLKCFLHSNWIRSRGNVEKFHSRFETFASHRALMSIFERGDVKSNMDSLLKENGDLLIVLDRLVSFKSLVRTKKFSSTVLLHKVQQIDNIKKRVYIPGNIEY